MKRKLLFVMFAAIGMMLATSCSNDEQVVQSGNEVRVTFSLGLENAMDARTISDGSGINQLFYAIFKGEELIANSENEEVDDFPHNTPITLLKGEEYTAVFWAWNKDCKAYSISEEKKSISIDYTNALNNDETRDAFFKSVAFTVTDNTTIDVVLKRAFAQFNVGITTEEWNTAKEQGKEIAKSKVEIKQAATILNLIDGSVESPKDITFETNDIPKDNLKVDVDCDGEAETFKYLSMCYFLANDTEDGASKTILEDLKITLFSANNEVIATLEEGLENTPVQRNHRTNIISSPEGTGGGILTGNITVNVSLDPLYDGEHTFTNLNVWEEYDGIYTEEALAGKTIELPASWHIRNGYILEPMPENWIAESTPLYIKSYTIDGKNNTVTFEPYQYKFVAKNAFAAADDQLVTIKDITFAGEHFGVFGGVYGGVSGRNNYNTVLENVKIIDNGIYCYNAAGSIPMSAFSNLGTAQVNNCTITGTYWVGAKDKNTNAQACYNNFEIYDIFVPNNISTVINNSRIGSIYVNNHGHLTISGTSTIDKIDAFSLVKGNLTIENGAKVTLLNINEYSPSYAPTVNIKAGATVETLQLNSIANTDEITIEEGATITTIIYKDIEYTSIADFNAAINKN